MRVQKATKLFLTVIVGYLIGVQFMPMTDIFVQTSRAMIKSLTQN